MARDTKGGRGGCGGGEVVEGVVVEVSWSESESGGEGHDAVNVSGEGGGAVERKEVWQAASEVAIIRERRRDG